MQLRIIETGEPPAPLNSQFGGYPAMFRRMLAPLAPEFSFSVTRTHLNEPMPALGEFDGVIITGSPAGVYEGHEWIEPAEEFLRRAAAAGKPVVGVCFGHQLLAQAFGGKVEKSAEGWGVGAHGYKINIAADWMTPMQSRITCAVSHQDQVMQPPKGARILGGSEFCPNGVIEYAQGPAISFQQHPEFSHDFAAALLHLRKDRIPEARICAGLDSLNGRSDRQILAQWMVKFLIQYAR